MKFLRKLILGFSLLSCSMVIAQNYADYSTYQYSLNIVNPAFAGQDKEHKILLNSKAQWIGIDKAPRTNLFVFNLPISTKNLGLGFTIMNDTYSYINETQLAIDASYKLILGEEMFFQFGLKAKGYIYHIDLTKYKTENSNDPLFSSNVRRFSPNFSFGGALVHESYFAHVVIDNILNDQRNNESVKSKMKNNLRLSIGGGYTYHLSDNVNLIPSTLLRLQEGNPIEFDINMMVNFNKNYNVNLSYYWNNSLLIGGLANVSNWLRLGYGYRFSTNDLIDYNDGTHEIMIILNFDKI